MISTKLNTLYKHLTFLALGALLIGPTLATAAALSISQVPLFITISLPPNVTVLLDDSGSMQWGHVPDWLGSGGTATVLITNIANTSSIPTTTVISTPGAVTGTVTSTPSTVSGSVIVATGTVNSGTVTSTVATYTTTGVIIGAKSGGKYPYSCPAGYSLNPSSPTSGSSSTASGYTCQKPATYTYSCAAGYTLNGSSSGSTSTPPGGTTCTQQTYNYSCSSGYTLGGSSTGTSSTGSGDTCQKTTYTYSCSSGYSLTGASTGTTSTPPGGDTCQKISYTYSCPAGYTLSGSSTGSTSTAPSSTTCNGAVIYSCPTGDTVDGGSGSSTTCSGYETFTATIDVANDNSSGGVYAPDTNHYKCACYNPRLITLLSPTRRATATQARRSAPASLPPT